jgi:polar amino acid transport system permease protein
MDQFTTWDIARNLLLATRWTILLSVIAFIGGGIVGFAIMLLRVSDLKPLRAVSIGYIDVLQGTPLLMQLFLCFFGISLHRPRSFAAGRCVDRADGLHQRVSRRNLARVRGRDSKGAA